MVQINVFNARRIGTVVVCALTSNLKRAQALGNVLPQKGEVNLRKKSVVNISQLLTVDKMDLAEKIGTLSSQKTQEIIRGIKLLLDPLPDPRS